MESTPQPQNAQSEMPGASVEHQRPHPLAYGEETLPRDDTSRGNMGIFVVRLFGLWLIVWNALEAAGWLVMVVDEWWSGSGQTTEPLWFVTFGINIAAGLLFVIFANSLVQFLRIAAPWPATPAVTPLAALFIAVMGLGFLIRGLVSGVSLLMAILEERDAFITSGFVFYMPYPTGSSFQIPWAQVVMVSGEAVAGILLILLCRRFARWLRLESLAPQAP